MSFSGFRYRSFSSRTSSISRHQIGPKRVLVQEAKLYLMHRGRWTNCWVLETDKEVVAPL
jgi:hypothetical protein